MPHEINLIRHFPLHTKAIILFQLQKRSFLPKKAITAKNWKSSSRISTRNCTYYINIFKNSSFYNDFSFELNPWEKCTQKKRNKNHFKHKYCVEKREGWWSFTFQKSQKKCCEWKWNSLKANENKSTGDARTDKFYLMVLWFSKEAGTKSFRNCLICVS